MSFGGDNTASQNPRLAGTRDSRANTNQQARVVPWVAGRVRIGCSFLSDKFAVVSQNKTSGKSDTGIGTEYWAGIAAVVSSGPVDALFAVYVNNFMVWPQATDDTATIAGILDEPSLTRGAAGTATADYVDITLSGCGPIRFYWGTETQTFDPTFIANALDHPAYRGFCYWVAAHFSLGLNQTNFPNIEFVIGRYPDCAWLGGSSPQLQHECNPVAAIADLLQHPKSGIALPDDRLDTVALASAAARLAVEKFRLSMIVDREQPARDLVLQIAEYFDGLPVVLDDKLGMVLACPAVGSIPAVATGDLVKRPELTVDDWSTTACEVRVTFIDLALELSDNYIPWRNPGNRQINDGLITPLVIDRPWITDATVATAVAEAAGRRNSLPMIKGKLSLRQRQALFNVLVPGQLFTLTVPDRTIGGLVFRVTSVIQDKPEEPEFSVEFCVDRSYLYSSSMDSLRAPTDDGGGGGGTGGGTFEDVGGIAVARIVELPAALCVGDRPCLAVLATRSDKRLIGFDIWLGRNYEGTWS